MNHFIGKVVTDRRINSVPPDESAPGSRSHHCRPIASGPRWQAQSALDPF